MASAAASCKSKKAQSASSPLNGGYMEVAIKVMEACAERVSTASTKRHRSRAYVPRVNHGGNYCGHLPDSPRLHFTDTTEKRRPGILIELQDRIDRFFADPNVLPSLRNASGSKRQMRSERREACIVLMKVIVEHMDLVSLRCGIPTRQGFMSLTLPHLVKFTGLEQRRAERALADLKKANLITVSQPRQLKEDGTWRGLAAVKAVNKLLFSVFGLHERLVHEIDRAAERLVQKVKQVGGTLTSWAKNALVIGRPKDTGKFRKPQPAVNTEERERVRMQLLAGLMIDHPAWTKDEWYAEADRIIAKKQLAAG